KVAILGGRRLYGRGSTMTFAERLRELRDKASLSEAKLADAAGLTFASVHGYGLGRRKPSFAAVVKIARALQVTCEAFADCSDMTDEPVKTKGARSRPPKQPAMPSTPPAAELQDAAKGDRSRATKEVEARTRAAAEVKRPRGRPRKGK